MAFQERTYRNNVLNHNFNSYNIVVRETDLFVTSDIDETESVLKSVYRYRTFIEQYIKVHPHFLTSLKPVERDPFAPDIIRDMIEVSQIVDVGPMAAVAGAIAQYVGFDLLRRSSNVIVENGGDIFMKAQNDLHVGLFAGRSTLSGKLKIRIRKREMPMGICTSSGTVGPSLSFGKADAVCVKSKSVSLADAAATALGNKIESARDIKTVLNEGKKIPGILGILVILGEHLGAWGDLELV
jgi:hypothetical protein